MMTVQDELMHFGVLGMKWGKSNKSVGNQSQKISKYEKKAIKAHDDLTKIENKAKEEYDPKTGPTAASRLNALSYAGKAIRMISSTKKMAKHISELDVDAGKKYFEEHQTPNWLIKDVRRNIKEQGGIT